MAQVRIALTARTKFLSMVESLAARALTTSTLYPDLEAFYANIAQGSSLSPLCGGATPTLATEKANELWTVSKPFKISQPKGQSF